MDSAVVLHHSINLLSLIHCQNTFALGCWFLHSPIKPYARPPIMSKRTAAVIRTPCLCRLISTRMYSALEVAGAALSLVPPVSASTETRGPLLVDSSRVA